MPDGTKPSPWPSMNSIRLSGANVDEFPIKFQTFLLTKMYSKRSFSEYRPFCSDLQMLWMIIPRRKLGCTYNEHDVHKQEIQYFIQWLLLFGEILNGHDIVWNVTPLSWQMKTIKRVLSMTPNDWQVKLETDKDVIQMGCRYYQHVLRPGINGHYFPHDTICCNFFPLIQSAAIQH